MMALPHGERAPSHRDQQKEARRRNDAPAKDQSDAPEPPRLNSGG